MSRLLEGWEPGSTAVSPRREDASLVLGSYSALVIASILLL